MRTSNLTNAFWSVINKIFKWRPIVLGCCDCGGTYYLTKNKIIRRFQNDEGKDEMVIACPYCGLEHLVLLVKLTDKTIAVKYETEEEVA